MNLKEMTGILDLKLNRACKQVELIGNDKDMALWLFDRDDQISGMVALESNHDVVNMPPTVSISVTLSNNVNLNVNELLKLFSINGLLFDATVTAEEVGGEWTLYLQKKVVIDAFKPEDFEPTLRHLMEQRKLIEA